jgi:protease I
MPRLQGKKVLMVVAANDFRDEEFFEPFNVLRRGGATITVASSIKGQAIGALGGKIATDRLVAECKAADYDAVVFVGGPGSSEFFKDPGAQALARDAAAGSKVLAAICIAPVTLANAGVLKDKQCTCFPSVQSQLAARGAKLVGQDVVRDGKLLTATGPAAAPAFAETLAKMLE